MAHVRLAGLLSIAVLTLSLTARAANAPSTRDATSDAHGRTVIFVDGFERGARGWHAVQSVTLHIDHTVRLRGFAALRLTTMGRSDAVMQYGGIGGLVGRHRIWIRASVKGTSGAFGRRLRLQLNEVSRVGRVTPVAAAGVRLTKRWQRLTATGRIRMSGDTIVPVVTLESAPRQASFFLDDYRITGDAGARYHALASDRAPTRVFIDGFDRRLAGWFGIGSPRLRIAHSVVEDGRGALQISATKPSDAGIQHSGIGGAIGGHRFWISVWVKGTPATVGKRFRVQLNEGAGDALKTAAVAWLAVAPYWQRITATGRTETEATTLTPTMVLERAPRGGTFYIDEYQLTGDADSFYQAVVARRVHNKASIWALTALWIVALAIAASLYGRRRRLAAARARRSPEN